jgi:hypothetical protein
VIYLIVGLDRDTFARWHQNIQADDVATAERIARDRASREGIALEVAAAIGPHSSVIEHEPVRSGPSAVPRAA